MGRALPPHHLRRTLCKPMYPRPESAVPAPTTYSAVSLGHIPGLMPSDRPPEHISIHIDVRKFASRKKPKEFMFNGATFGDPLVLLLQVDFHTDGFSSLSTNQMG